MNLSKAERSLLNLVIYFPLFSILGNLLPSFSGIKINVVYTAILLIYSFVILVLKNKIQILIPFLIIIFSHLVLDNILDIKTLSSLFSSLFVFLALPLSQSIPPNKIKIFLFLSLTPSLIAVLQVFEVLPIAYGQLEFVNKTIWGEDTVIRPNGFLYSAYELSVTTIIGLIVFYNVYKRKINVLLFFLIASYIIYIFRLRSALVLWLLFVLLELKKYYETKSLKLIIYPISIIACFYVVIINLESIKELFQFAKLTSVDTRGQFLTGRINIWITILHAYMDADLLTKIFGFGEAYSMIFLNSDYWSSEYVPGTHNIFLEYFIITGLFGFLYAIFLISKSISKINISNQRILKVFFYIFLLTFGMTGPLLQNAFFGIGFYFILKTYIKN